LPGRDEHHQSLVAPYFHQGAVSRLHHLADNLCEARSERRRGLVSVLLRVLGVAADIRDQKGADVSSVLGLMLRIVSDAGPPPRVASSGRLSGV